MKNHELAIFLLRDLKQQISNLRTQQKSAPYARLSPRVSPDFPTNSSNAPRRSPSEPPVPLAAKNSAPSAGAILNAPQGRKNSAAPVPGLYPAPAFAPGKSQGGAESTDPTLPSGSDPQVLPGSSSSEQSGQNVTTKNAIAAVDSALQNPQITLTPLPEETSNQPTEKLTPQARQDGGKPGNVLDNAVTQHTNGEGGARAQDQKLRPLDQETPGSTTVSNDSSDGVDPLAKALNNITTEDMRPADQYLPHLLIPERPLDLSNSSTTPASGGTDQTGMPPDRLIDQGPGYADAQRSGLGQDSNSTGQPARLEDGSTVSADGTQTAPLNQKQPDTGELYVITDPATPLELARIAQASSGSPTRSFLGGLTNFGKGLFEFIQSDEGQQLFQTLKTVFPAPTAGPTMVPNGYGSICGPGYVFNAAKLTAFQSYVSNTPKVATVQKAPQQSAKTAGSSEFPCKDLSIVGLFKCEDELLKEFDAFIARAKNEGKQMDNELAKLKNAQSTAPMRNPDGSSTAWCVPAGTQK